jgi:hypothetical protein
MAVAEMEHGSLMNSRADAMAMLERLGHQITCCNASGR